MKAVLREGGPPLGILLAATLAFKLLFQIDYNAHNPLAAHPVADEALYIEMAGGIAQGGLSPGEVFHMAPLYPYLIAPVFAVCGRDPFAARLFQSLLGTGSVLLLYLAARSFLPRRWSLIAAGALLLYYPITFFEAKLLIATSAVFFITLSLWLLLWQRRLNLVRLSIAAGPAAGAAAALRPNLILLIPFLVPWFLLSFRGRKGWAACTLFLAGAALPVLPFTLHNYIVGNDLVLLSDNGGINFYLGNNYEARGSFHITDPAWGDIEYQHVMARSIAEEEAGRPLKPSAVSRFWMRRGLDFITEHPGRYIGLLLRKLKSFLENFEYAIIYTPPVERGLTATLWAAFLPFAAFIACAALGLAVLPAGRRADGCAVMAGATGPESRAGTWSLPAVFLVVNVLSVLLFFNYSRFRLTAIPALVLLGVYGIREWAALCRQRIWRTVALSALSAAVALALSLFPYGDQWRLQTAHGLATIGTAYAAERDFKAAEDYYTRALEVRPGLDIILVKRGNARIESKKYEAAREDLEEAVRLKPDCASHIAALAAFHARDRESPYRDLDQALELVLEAAKTPMRTPVEKAHVLVVEGNIRMEREEYPEAARAYEEAALLVAEPVDALFLSGLAWKRAGETEKARSAFLRVLHLDPDHSGARQELEALDR